VIDRGTAAAPIGEESPEMTDEQIISRVRGGETRIFEELVARYQDSVYSMALRFVGGRGDADDVAQEVFLRAYRGLAGFKGNAKFSTWLYRITFNLCADWLRRNKRADRRAATIEAAAKLADSRVNLEAGVVMAEERDTLRSALDRLDERYRSVVVLLYYQKMSYEQIAAVLELPVKTVETRLYRARKMLREKLVKGGEGGVT
jgi:RNA polymerase sigma-70 factor (ECF subfamily)